METSNESQSDLTNADDENVFYVKNEPVMQCAINVLDILGKSKKITLKAKGLSIPNAVAIANIITEKMLKGNSEIKKIILDSDAPVGFGRMTSTVEIILNKK